MLAYGQQQPRQFDVAVIKPVERDSSPMAAAVLDLNQETLDSVTPVGSLPIQNGHLLIPNRTLQSIIGHAYSVRSRDIVGPAWMKETRFYIEAKIPDGSPAGSANQMLQSLLRERFGLETHRESRVVVGFKLIRTSRDVRLKPAASAEAGQSEQEGISAAEIMAKRMAATANGSRGVPSMGSRFFNITMAEFAEDLARRIQAPVVDDTSLQGRYDFEIDLAPFESSDNSPGYGVAPALAPLGLKLKRAKVRVEVLVVDSVSKIPTPN